MIDDTELQSVESFLADGAWVDCLPTAYDLTKVGGCSPGKFLPEVRAYLIAEVWAREEQAKRKLIEDEIEACKEKLGRLAASLDEVGCCARWAFFDAGTEMRVRGPSSPTVYLSNDGTRGVLVQTEVHPYVRWAKIGSVEEPCPRKVDKG